MTQTTIVLNPKRTEYGAEDARIVVSDYAEYMYAPVTVSDLHEHVEEE